MSSPPPDDYDEAQLFRARDWHLLVLTWVPGSGAAGFSTLLVDVFVLGSGFSGFIRGLRRRCGDSREG